MPTFSTVFFDMDATLYPVENGLWPKIKENIEAFLRVKMGLPAEEAQPLMYRYYYEYGTTLRGLQENHQIDPYMYLNFVHDIPVDQYLSPDPVLRATIEALNVPAWVFTNSDGAYSRRVLEALGLAGCFAGLIAIEDLDFESKPRPKAFEKALAIAGEPDPNRVVFIEDSLRNLAGAREFGINGILVDPGAQNSEGFPQIARPHDLPGLMPELFGR